jgi:OmpA-OmpF porin, OOP family
MRLRAMLAVSLWLAAGAIVPVYGQSASDSKAESIIRSLTPTAATDGRGIRIAHPPGGQTSGAVTPAAAGAPVSGGEAPSVSMNIQFLSGSATLTPAAMHDLDSLGRALGDQRLAAYRFRIEGHTDTVGSRPYNQALSQRRAEAVAGYLESKYQIDAARLAAIGMGEDGLLVATPDQTPELRNRRVLVVNVGS